MTNSQAPAPNQTRPILLYNDECGVCRRIARWVKRSAHSRTTGADVIVEQPIGDDPDALGALNQDLNIWDAYATIHLLMPDGSMKLGGEAVAEIFRALPRTRWFAWTFAVSVFGFRPSQTVLNMAYALLADVRPLFGCESCGTPSSSVKAIRWTIKWVRARFGGGRHPSTTAHFSVLSPTAHPPR
jgi:predicted DCC family thiol-disulfide oxidoreductase YuxK